MPRNLGPEDFIAHDAGLPCLNPNCKSHGAPHIGCKCYSRSGGVDFSSNASLASANKVESSALGEYRSFGHFAHGGDVHFCSSNQPHLPDCEYYASGGDVEQNAKFHSNPELAVDRAIASHGLLHLLTKTGHSRSENPHKSLEEFVSHSKKGHEKIKNHIKESFDKKYSDADPGDENVVGLKNHIDTLRQNPEKMLEIGGSLGDDLPDHSGIIAAKAANASQYLNGLKPLAGQNSPFDRITPASKIEENNYHRQFKIAEQPLSILKHIKQGTVSPSDIKTLQTLYPQLSQSIMDHTFQQVAEAKENKTLIPYKQRMGLSALMGPLDSTQTPQAMQAIIHSASGNTESPSQQKSGGATAQTQKTMEKTDKMYETRLDQLQIDHK
jgi:hypothetical protein